MNINTIVLGRLHNEAHYQFIVAMVASLVKYSSSRCSANPPPPSLCQPCKWVELLCSYDEVATYTQSYAFGLQGVIVYVELKFHI
jgi:hypothetical protein